MTEKIQLAINKIDDESDKLHDTNATMIASHIIDTYLISDKNAEKVLNKKKTLKGCLDKIKSRAKQEATNNVAMIDSDTVLSWAKDYYGFAVDCKENSSDKIVNLFDFI